MTERLIRVGIDLHTWECAVQNKSRVSSVLFVGDHGGSTLLPPNVTNEFPEYGTMEGSGEGLRASLEFDAESLLRCPGGPQGAQKEPWEQHPAGTPGLGRPLPILPGK